MKLWMVCGWPETTMKRHSSVALVFSSISGGCSKSSCNRFLAKSSSSKKLGSPQEPQKRHMLEPLRTGSNFQDPPGQRAREEPWSLILFWRGLTKLVSSRYKFHTIFQSKNVTFGVRWTRLLCESLQVNGEKRATDKPLPILEFAHRPCTMHHGANIQYDTWWDKDDGVTTAGFHMLCLRQEVS